MTASSLRRFGATAIMFLAAIIASATAQDSLCVYDCAGANGGEYPLPPLGYGYDSLEPNVNNETMTFHHDVHFAGYTRKMNAALEELNQMGFDGATSVADMLANIGFSAPVFGRSDVATSCQSSRTISRTRSRTSSCGPGAEQEHF